MNSQKGLDPWRRCTIDDSCVRGAREVNVYGDAAER